MIIGPIATDHDHEGTSKRNESNICRLHVHVGDEDGITFIYLESQNPWAISFVFIMSRG